MRKQLGAAAALGLVLAAGAAPVRADEPPAAEAAATWEADFDAAAARAKAEGKDLLVDFTGSDWCGWCIRLDEEVFRHGAFLEPATRDYVLVALDFPRKAEAKARVPNPARNEELQRKYGVQGFPTVLLMTPEGHVYGRTGYQQGGADAYVQHLNELRAARAPLSAALDLVKRFEAAAGVDKLALAEEAVAKAEANREADWAAALDPTVKAAIELDPDDSKGLRNRAVGLLLDSRRADASTLRKARSIDPRNELGLYEKSVLAECAVITQKEQVPGALETVARYIELGTVKDRDTAAKILANGAFWQWRVQEDVPKAKAWAQKVRELGTDDPRINQLVDAILAVEEQPADPGTETGTGGE